MVRPPAAAKEGVRTRGASGKQPVQMDLLGDDLPPAREQHPRFSPARAAAFTARRVSAVFNVVKEDGFVAVTDPEPRGCCMPFSHIGAMWPSLFKHGLDMTTYDDMKESTRHEGVYSTT